MTMSTHKTIPNLAYRLEQYFANFSVRTKLTIAFLLVSLSSLTLLVYLNSRFVQSALTDEAERGLQVAAARTADSFHSFIKTNLENIDSEAQIPIIQDFLLLPERRAQY